MMGLAAGGAKSAQRTLAGEGSSRVPRDRGKVNAFVFSWSHQPRLADVFTFVRTASPLEIRLAGSVLRPISPGMGPFPSNPTSSTSPNHSLPQPSTYYRRRGPWLRGP
jgi:hypothetical protein